MLGVYDLSTPIGFSCTRTLGLKHDRVFLKRGHVFKKDGHLSNPMSGCRKIQPVQDDYTPQTPTSQSINQRVYKMQVFSANSLKKTRKHFVYIIN